MAVYQDKNSTSQKPRISQIRREVKVAAVGFVKPTEVIGQAEAQKNKGGRPKGYSPKKNK